MSLSPGARGRLIAIARQAIDAELRGRPAPRPDLRLDAELLRKSGAFVTLSRKQDGELRGCVGYIEPVLPLAETVARAAVGAAMKDGRFPAVRPDELPSLSVHVSVLAPPVPIDPERVEVGRHGLIVQRGSFRGLLLPQVPAEWGWDREGFLEAVCRKAGLPGGAWKEPDTELLAFEAEVFGEEP